MVRTVRLGGTASHIEVANVSHGIMFMTWLPNPIPDEQAFKAIKDGIDAAGGAKVLLNSGEFYGKNLDTSNLGLLARFYEKYPEYVDRTVLAVQGGMALGTLMALATEENIRRSIDTVNEKLRGNKRVDIFENSRVDPAKPIEDTIQIMKKLVQEGKFDHIGLSECSAETVRRANAVHPIACVEIEVSAFSYEEETRKVIAAIAELNIPVLAYSPLGRGFLTGRYRSVADVPKADMRDNGNERLDPDNFKHNLQLVDLLTVIAKREGITPGQLCLAWVISLGPHMIPLPGSSKFTRTLENLAASDIMLSAEERAEINKLIDSFEVRGSRYPPGIDDLWG